jgi:hypothetical protein
VLAVGFGWLAPAWALPQQFGDLDQDGQPTVLDVVRLVNHLCEIQPLRSDFVPFADVDTNGVINDADVDALVQAVLGLTNLPPVLDSDGDGLPDELEPLLGPLDPDLKDTDGDGVADGDEDFDQDFLSNTNEIALGTNPMDPDTDHDGWSDGAGFDPLNPNSHPGYIVAQPAVSVMLPRAGGGTVVAQPLVMVALSIPPTNVLGGLVAQPLVLVNLPYPLLETNAGPVLAQPLIMVALPSMEENTNALAGPVVAQPLVMVAWEEATNQLAPSFGASPSTKSNLKPVLSK